MTSKEIDVVYDIVTSSDPRGLSNAINIRISEGWQAIGGVAVVEYEGYDGSMWEYSQAVIKT